MVSCAVEECHAPSLYGALLLARQCSLEGAHLFPPYRQWVQVCFPPPPLSSSPSLSSLLPSSSSLSLPLPFFPSSLLPSLLPSVHFTSYLQQMFGDSRTTVVTSKHALQFLLKCLTEAVPHEPPFALRVGVHSSSPPPFTPLSVFLLSFLLVLLLTLFSLPQAHIESPPRRMARCHVLLSDYISLAKTRLRELNVCTAVCGQ